MTPAVLLPEYAPVSWSICGEKITAELGMSVTISSLTLNNWCSLNARKWVVTL